MHHMTVRPNRPVETQPVQMAAVVADEDAVAQVEDFLPDRFAPLLTNQVIIRIGELAHRMGPVGEKRVDGRIIAFARGHDLAVKHLCHGGQRPFTTDIEKADAIAWEGQQDVAQRPLVGCCDNGT